MCKKVWRIFKDLLPKKSINRNQRTVSVLTFTVIKHGFLMLFRRIYLS